MLADAARLGLRRGQLARVEPLERLERDLEDGEEAGVAEGAGDLPVLRERARVRRRVHLRHELVQHLQPEDEVRRRRLEELGDLVQDLLLVVEVHPSELGDAREQLDERRAHKVLARRPLLARKFNTCAHARESAHVVMRGTEKRKEAVVRGCKKAPPATHIIPVIGRCCVLRLFQRNAQPLECVSATSCVAPSSC